MAKCFVSDKDTFAFQYVSLEEAPEIGQEQRVLHCRFDHLGKAEQSLPPDFREPILVRWNPGPKGDRLGLQEHARLANLPKLRALPGMVRVKVRRDQLRAKLSQLIEARSRLLND